MRVREERQHFVKIALTFSWMDSSMDVNYYYKKRILVALSGWVKPMWWTSRVSPQPMVCDTEGGKKSISQADLWSARDKKSTEVVCSGISLDQLLQQQLGERMRICDTRIRGLPLTARTLKYFSNSHPSLQTWKNFFLLPNSLPRAGFLFF